MLMWSVNNLAIPQLIDMGALTTWGEYVCYSYTCRIYILAIIDGDRYSRGTGTIWLSNVGCNYADIFLANCTHSGFGNAFCYHNQDVAISCTQSRSKSAFSYMVTMHMHTLAHTHTHTHGVV